MRSRLRVLIPAVPAFLVPVLTGCDSRVATPTVPIAVSSPGSASPGPAAPTQKQQLLELINQDRARVGVAPLALDLRVAEVAREWAAQLAREQRLRHRPDPAAALASRGVHDWRVTGENVGVGGHVDDVQSAFLASPGHRDRARRADYSRVGIGVTERDGRVWVTVNFVG